MKLEEPMSASAKDAEINSLFAREIALGWSVNHIYMLIDPRTEEIRYVGKSIRPHQRLQNHMNEPPTNCHRSHWLAELRGLNLIPDLVVIETVAGEWPWQEVEKHWIRKLRADGARLVNNTDGGDGVEGLPEETRKRMAAVWKGRKHRPETIAKLKARPVRIATTATRLKMSASQTGRKITWGAKLSEAIRKLDVATVDQIRARLNAGEMGITIAKEYGLHRTTVSKIKMGTYFEPYRKQKAGAA